MRLPASTSLTSLIERSWPTASGVSVSGKATVSRSGKTGRASGRSRETPRSIAPSAPGRWSMSSSVTVSPLVLRRLRHLDRHAARLLFAEHERNLDLQEAVLVDGPRVLPAHVRPERDRALERAVLDLELLVDAALGILGPTMARDRQLAALDLQRQLVGVDARELRAHDDPGPIVRV